MKMAGIAMGIFNTYLVGPFLHDRTGTIGEEVHAKSQTADTIDSMNGPSSLPMDIQTVVMSARGAKLPAYPQRRPVNFPETSLFCMRLPVGVNSTGPEAGLPPPWPEDRLGPGGGQGVVGGGDGVGVLLECDECELVDCLGPIGWLEELTRARFVLTGVVPRSCAKRLGLGVAGRNSAEGGIPGAHWPKTMGLLPCVIGPRLLPGSRCNALRPSNMTGLGTGWGATWTGAAVAGTSGGVPPGASFPFADLAISARALVNVFMGREGVL